MAVAAKKLLVEEYLELEKSSEVRHEYVDGHLFEITCEKRVHNAIVGNLLLILSPITDKKGGELVFESVKLQTRATRFRYPNIAISLSPSEDDYSLDNPCFIAEVTSHNSQGSLMSKASRIHELTEFTKLHSYCRR
jgi:Uma2 family endonuclease